MAKKGKIAASIVLDGEKEFNAAVTSCNKKLAALRSELKLNKEAHAENANSLEALRSKQEVLTKILGEYRNREEAVLRGQQNAISAKNKLKSSLEALCREQEQEVKKLEEMRKASDGSSKELEEQEKVVGELSDRISKGNQNLQTAEDRIQKWGIKLNSAQADTLKANRALEQNRKYMGEASNAADGCATSIDRYGNKVRAIKVEVQEMGRESESAVGMLANTIVASGAADKVEDIAEALYDCSEAAGAFEKASQKVSTIADNSKVSMEEINRQMLSVSSETGQAVGSIAEATYQAISASVDTADAVNTVSTATKASIGGFTDSETAIDGLTTVMNSYGDKVKDAMEVSDVFITVQKLGKTSFGELASSIGKVATSAANYNMSVQDLGAAYVELTKRGIQTSEATTYTNSLLKELSKNGSVVSKTLKSKTGKSFAELMEDGNSLADVIAILSDSVKGNATAFSNLFSSQEAGVAATVLMKTGTEEYNKTLQAVTDSAGATEEAYQKMADTSEHAKEKLVNGVQNLKIAIGEELNESLDGLYEKGGKVIDWATEFVQEHPDIVRAVTAIATGVGVLTAAFAGFTVATQVLIPMINKFTLALAANPIGAVAVALTTLITIIGTFTAMSKNAAEAVDKEAEANKKAREAIEEKTRAVKESVDAAREDLQATKDDISTTENMVSRLQSLNGIQNKTLGQKKEIQAIVESLQDKIPELAKAYDKESGSVRLTKEEIKKLTKAYKEQAIAEGMQKQLKASVEAAAEAEMNLAKAKDQAAKASKRKEDAEKAEKAAHEASMEAVNKYADFAVQKQYVEEWKKKKAALEAATAEEKKSQKALQKSGKVQEQANAQVKDAQDFYEKYEKQLDQTAKKQKKQTDEVQKTKKSYDGLKQAFQKAKAGMEGWGQKVGTDVEQGFAKAVRMAEKTGTKIPKGLTKGLKDGSKSPATATNELNQTISKKLLELCDDAKDAGAYIPEKLTAGLKEGKLDVGKAFEGINMAVSKKADEQQRQMKKSGLKISKAMKEAYAKGGVDSIKAIKEADKKMAKLQEEAGVHSVNGLLKGLEKGMPRVRAACENMADDLSASFRKKWKIHSPSRVFAEIGSYAMLGIIQGTDGQKKNLQKKYTEMAESIDVAFRKALEIHSPSKKMARNSKYIVEGTIYGIKQNKKKLDKASEKLGASAAEKAKKAAKKKAAEKQNRIVKKADNKASTKNMNEKEIADVWKKAVKETKKGTDAYVKAVKKYKQAKEKLLKDEKKLKQDFKKNYSDYMKNLKSQISDYKKQIKDLKNTYTEAVASTQSSIAGTWGMFGKAEVSRTNNAAGLIRNMKTQADTAEQYKQNMDKLRGRGLSKDLIKDLESAGISSAGDVATLAAMNDKQLQEYQKYYEKRQDYARQEALTQNAELKASTDKQVAALKEKMKKVEQTYKKKIDSLEKKLSRQMKKLGLNVTDGFVKGIESGSSSVYKAIAKMTGQTVKQVKKNLGIHSPSRVFDEIGRNTGLGFAQGLQKETEGLPQILTDALPKSVGAPSAGGAGSRMPDMSAPVQLNMYMDSQHVAAAIFSTIDLMQGANIRLISRGLAR